MPMMLTGNSGVPAGGRKKKLATDPPVSEKQRKAMWAAKEGRSTLGIPKSVGEKFVGKGHDNFERLFSPTPKPKQKLSQESVHYGEGKGYDKCGYCLHFSAPDGCKLVGGKISGDGWCDRFVVATEEKVPLEEMLAMDRSMVGDLRDGLAFDRGSVRMYSVDGHLHVEATPISKANVCPYFGNEIPDWQLLGLDPKKVYKLLRDPAELEKAAPTFNNLPLLRKHVPVSAKAHAKEDVVGSTGTDGTFAHPYLMNSLVIWTDEDITGVETGKKRELSSAYRYRADMTPGVHDGAPYDGVMRDIVGNHVALVAEGRAGSDVLVGDSINPSLQEIFQMAKSTKSLSRKVAFAQGALAGYLMPKLAQDAKIDLNSALAGVTPKNFADKIGTISASVIAMTKGKLAQDAKLDDLKKFLLAIDEAKVEEPKAEDMEDPAEESEAEEAMDEDDEEAEDKEIDEEAEEEKAEKDQEKPLPNKDKKGKDKKAKDKFPMKGKDKKAKDETAEEEMDEDKDKKPAKDKKAMDQAIKAASQIAADAAIKRERALQKSIYEARLKVMPYVGDLSAIAFDSAEGVYQHAIKTAPGGRDVSEIEDITALETILDLLPKPGQQHSHSPTVSMDSAQRKSFQDRFPGTKGVTIGSPVA